MRRFVVEHEKKRLAPRPILDERYPEIRDDVGDVSPSVGRLAIRRVEHRVHVHALSGEDVPDVEPRRIAAQMPLPNHARVVAGPLEQLRDREPRAVEAIEHRHTVQV